MSDRDLEQQLTEAGSRLVDPPSDVDELLSLLDQVENCLSRVEQSPSKSMQKALAPSLNALVVDKLFRHLNVDVKAAVASCISEITRITAPDAPYDDDKMRDVFQLIVSSFENLDDKSSRSYKKKISILETVAKVRSCVLMLDLECDALIIEMFQQFFKAIRDFHPENVFSSMETIMSLVVEESEDVLTELLIPLLDSVKKNNEGISPVARKLGEKVLESSAAKIKPYLVHAVKSLGILIDDYSDIVASICQELRGSVEQNDIAGTDENKVETEGSKDTGAVSIEVDEKVGANGNAQQTDHGKDKTVDSVVSNGVSEANEDSASTDPNAPKDEEATHTGIDTSDNAKAAGSEKASDADAEKVNNIDDQKPSDAENKQEVTTKEGQEVDDSVKSPEPSQSMPVDEQKEVEKQPDLKSENKDVLSSPHEDQTLEIATSSLDQKEGGSQLSSPKGLEGETIPVASPSMGESVPHGSTDNKGGIEVEKEKSAEGVGLSADDAPKKTSEGTSDSESKPLKRPARKATASSSNEEKKATASEVKPLKSKKMDKSSTSGDEPSFQRSEDSRQGSRGKTLPEKKEDKGSTEDSDRKKIASTKASKSSNHGLLEETPKTSDKRTHSQIQEKASEAKEYDEEVVGRRVKVWWPKDRTFYKGVIDDYDSSKKKHKVLYDDGEVEILNLKRQKFEFIDSDSDSDEGEAADDPSPDSSAEIPLKKKAKTNLDQANKSKSKSVPAKSASKTPVHSGGKTKENTHKTSNLSKSASKPKSQLEETPKTGKGKTPKSSGKSTSSKAKEPEDDENSTDVEEEPRKASAKRKSTISLKELGSGTKSGKKRQKA